VGAILARHDGTVKRQAEQELRILSERPGDTRISAGEKLVNRVTCTVRRAGSPHETR